MSDQQEVEWQFDATDLDLVERWLTTRPTDSGVAVSSGATLHLIDSYYDTTDWRCWRGGFSFRIRQYDSEIEATIKGFKSNSTIEGLRSRKEITQPIDRHNLRNLENFKNQKGVVSDCLRLVAGSHILRPIFDVQTNRRTFEVTQNGKPLGEVTLDATTVTVDKKQTHLTRIEVEVPPLLVDTIQEFVDEMRAACKLLPASKSKFGTGMQLGEYDTTFTLDLGSLNITPASSIGETAFAVMRKNFVAFLACEPAVMMGDDPEAIHRMRVASRRLRSAIRLFEPYLSVRVIQMRNELSWTAAALGAVRDLDVQITQMGEWVTEPELIRLLLKERDNARKKLTRELSSKRYATLVRVFSAVLKRGTMSRANVKARALDVAPQMIAPHWKKIRQAVDGITADSLPAEYHALRIRGKRLRYAVEFFSDLYGEAANDLITRLVQMQDVLGKHQDAEVAMPRLRDIALQHGDVLPPQTLLTIGELTQRYEQQAHDLRLQVPKAFKKMRKRWKKLKRVMLENVTPIVADQLL